jgi:pimeloyl-ACP methyl ester carboxylesterase
MEDQFIEIESCKIRYRYSGNTGPVILFIHGIGESLEFWTPQMDTAVSGFKFISLDLPGHGLSGFGDQPYEPVKFSSFVWRFVDALKPEELYLVGNSMGAAISILMAGERPQDVSGMILANSASLGLESPLPFRLMTLPVIGGILTRPGKMAEEQQIKALFHDPAIVTDGIRKVVYRNVSRPGLQQAFLKTLRLMTHFFGQRRERVDKSIEILASLNLPVLFVHGRQDAVVPVAHTIEAQKKTPNSKLVVLDDCGHTPQIEKPERFNKLLKEFVGAC